MSVGTSFREGQLVHVSCGLTGAYIGLGLIVCAPEQPSAPYNRRFYEVLVGGTKDVYSWSELKALRNYNG